MTEALTVSAIQYQALDGGIMPNVDEHVRLIEDAESHGARLVVFPELSLTGYNLPLLADDDAWLRPDDPRLGDLHEICRRTGITAVAGAATGSLTARRGSRASPSTRTAPLISASRPIFTDRSRRLFTAGDVP